MILGDKHAGVILNEFIYFKESAGITKAPILGVRCNHKELVQTGNGFYMYSNNLEAVVFVLCPTYLESAKYVGGDGMGDIFVLRYWSDDKEILKMSVPFPDDSLSYLLSSNQGQLCP
jgi:hypothetical protein